MAGKKDRPDVPERSVDTLLDMLAQVKRLYRSSFGADLQPADWLAFQKSVEKFDRQTDGLVLGNEKKKLPVLVQPAAVLQALIDPKAGDLESRAYHLLGPYEFVFQVVGPKTLPRLGPKVARVLDAVLEPLGMERGMDLAPFQAAINAVTQPDYHVLRERRSLTEEDADFHFEMGRTEGMYSSVSLKFESPLSVVARFERGCWWTPVLDREVRSDLRCDVHGAVTEMLEHMYWMEPEQLKRRPVAWLLLSETAFHEKPKRRGSGWKHNPKHDWWERNEVLWLAPGAKAADAAQ